jgi:RNA polymerase sigma-70 factor (sigma-E family)
VTGKFGGRYMERELVTPAVVDRRPAVPSVFTELLDGQWTALVRLAALLLDSSDQAEDVVQEAVISCMRREARLRDPAAAAAYLRRAVVNTARSTVRRRLVAMRHRPTPDPDVESAEESAYATFERAAVVIALRTLPRRQREAVTLRYFSELSEAETAALMGCSTGSVKAYTSRGIAALGIAMEDWR